MKVNIKYNRLVGEDGTMWALEVKQIYNEISNLRTLMGLGFDDNSKVKDFLSKYRGGRVEVSGVTILENYSIVTLVTEEANGIYDNESIRFSVTSDLKANSVIRIDDIDELVLSGSIPANSLIRVSKDGNSVISVSSYMDNSIGGFNLQEENNVLNDLLSRSNVVFTSEEMGVIDSLKVTALNERLQEINTLYDNLLGQTAVDPEQYLNMNDIIAARNQLEDSLIQTTIPHYSLDSDTGATSLISVDTYSGSGVIKISSNRTMIQGDTAIFNGVNYTILSRDTVTNIVPTTSFVYLDEVAMTMTVDLHDFEVGNQIIDDYQKYLHNSDLETTEFVEEVETYKQYLEYLRNEYTVHRTYSNLMVSVYNNSLPILSNVMSQLATKESSQALLFDSMVTKLNTIFDGIDAVETTYKSIAERVIDDTHAVAEYVNLESAGLHNFNIDGVTTLTGKNRVILTMSTNIGSTIEDGHNIQLEDAGTQYLIAGIGGNLFDSDTKEEGKYIFSITGNTINYIGNLSEVYPETYKVGSAITAATNTLALPFRWLDIITQVNDLGVVINTDNTNNLNTLATLVTNTLVSRGIIVKQIEQASRLLDIIPTRIVEEESDVTSVFPDQDYSNALDVVSQQLTMAEDKFVDVVSDIEDSMNCLSKYLSGTVDATCPTNKDLTTTLDTDTPLLDELDVYHVKTPFASQWSQQEKDDITAALSMTFPIDSYGAASLPSLIDSTDWSGVPTTETRVLDTDSKLSNAWDLIKGLSGPTNPFTYGPSYTAKLRTLKVSPATVIVYDKVFTKIIDNINYAYAGGLLVIVDSDNGTARFESDKGGYKFSMSIANGDTHYDAGNTIYDGIPRIPIDPANTYFFSCRNRMFVLVTNGASNTCIEVGISAYGIETVSSDDITNMYDFATYGAIQSVTSSAKGFNILTTAGRIIEYTDVALPGVLHPYTIPSMQYVDRALVTVTGEVLWLTYYRSIYSSQSSNDRYTIFTLNGYTNIYDKEEKNDALDKNGDPMNGVIDNRTAATSGLLFSLGGDGIGIINTNNDFLSIVNYSAL